MAAGPRPPAAEGGRARRATVPRRSLAQWDPGAREQDALATILAQDQTRDPDLVPIRHGRMGASPWTYYRGAAAVMAADLASAPNTGIGVQLCGDAHVLNFGLWKTPERILSFDLNDFDETLPGPFEWDVKRFLTGLVVLARENGIRNRETEQAVRAGFAGYRKWIHRYAQWSELDVWYDTVDAERLVKYTAAHDGKLEKRLERQAARNTNRGAFAKLTRAVDGRRQIVDRPPYRAHADIDLNRLDAVLGKYTSTVPDHLGVLLDHYDVVDAVRQVVGVGSVGMRDYLVLCEDRRTGDPLFLQVKQAGASVYEQWIGKSRYADAGERVVVGQRLLQRAPDMFLGWTTVKGMDFYVRQFRDGKVVADSAQLVRRLPEYAHACGRVLARAHARSGDAAEIDDYLGRSRKVADAFTAFAFAYDRQNAHDHAQLAAAIEDGTVAAEPGWP
ncbi:DUF2252 domain-containing protein [Gordonia sp. (in: high G+C Gram-positive bacteria)]|uniref:DUF2252 domain-containing protein n=1 Tax=Gordonia sp. (in: high G+C Gram-positive bacteria) TaxID=84139 RepID=UPI0039E68B9D